MPEVSKEKPLEHSQLKLPGVLTQEAREPHPLFGPAHSLLSKPDWKNVHGRQHHNGTNFSPECYIQLTDTGCLVLREPSRALASEASNSVDTVELAVVLLRRAFIHI